MDVRFIKPLTTIHVAVTQASIADTKVKIALDSHADTCIVADNCLVIHDHNRSVNVFSYDPNDASTMNAAVCHDNLHGGQKDILMINHSIQISVLVNHLFCPI